MNRIVTASLACAAAVGAVAASTPAATAAVVPRHAVVVCDSASFYENYDSASGPVNLKRTLFSGNKIGHTPGVHPVYNGWAATFDFGPNDWGFMRIECIGGYDSW
jgi:opacity protein-like surface antigen